MKSRNYSYAQQRESCLFKDSSRKLKSGGPGGVHRNRRSGFSSSDLRSERDILHTKDSSHLKSDQYREKATLGEEYVVLRGAVGSKSALHAFSPGPHYSKPSLLLASAHKPKVKKTILSKRCQNCRLAVKKSNTGSAHVYCKGCSGNELSIEPRHVECPSLNMAVGLWHNACAPASRSYQSKNFLCSGCLATNPPKRSKITKLPSRSKALLSCLLPTLKGTDIFCRN